MKVLFMIPFTDYLEKEKRTKVFIDIGSENKETQRVVIELLV